MNSVSPLRTEAQELLAYSMKHALKYQSNIRNFTTSITKVIRDEPVILARLGFVVSCSMGGWVLGYKGRPFRKLAYASICGSVATVISFPSGSVSNLKHAFDIGSNKLSEIAKRFSLRLFTTKIRTIKKLGETFQSLVLKVTWELQSEFDR
ncbi:unnamed protein product [Schistosoma margrebowiei]|nr:unnamed protein product [Schistosoma margrebowiei]